MKNRILKFEEFLVESIEFLGEAESTDISYLDETVGIFGASKTPANNKDAIKKFVELGVTSLKIADIEGLSEKSMIAYGVNPKKPGSSAKTWHLRDKPADLVTKDYIKIGDRIIKNEGGKFVYLPTTRGTISDNGAEFYGNGVYAMARLLGASKSKNISKDSKTIICLNTKKPTAITLNSKTGFQSGLANFRGACVSALIMGKVVIPNKGNTQSMVTSAIKLRDNKSDAQENFSNSACPALGDPELKKEIIGKIPGKIDISAFITEFGGKGITGFNSEAKKATQFLIDNYYEKFMELYSERFIGYLDDSLEASGIPKGMLDETKGNIKAYSKNEEGKKQAQYDLINGPDFASVKLLFEPKKELGSTTRPGASTTTKTSSSKDGDMEINF